MKNRLLNFSEEIWTEKVISYFVVRMLMPLKFSICLVQVSFFVRFIDFLEVAFDMSFTLESQMNTLTCRENEVSVFQYINSISSMGVNQLAINQLRG